MRKRKKKREKKCRGKGKRRRKVLEEVEKKRSWEKGAIVQK
ncbi:hypothetical protein ACW0TE_00570 [Fusobacterium polymorphum]